MHEAAYDLGYVIGWLAADLLLGAVPGLLPAYLAFRRGRPRLGAGLLLACAAAFAGLGLAGLAVAFVTATALALGVKRPA